MSHEYESDPAAFYKLVSMRLQRDSNFSVAHLKWIDFSVGYGLYHVFQSALKAPIGYIIWAYVDDETIVRLHDRKRFPVYGYEWSEGVTTLVLDIVYLGSTPRLSAALLRKALPRDTDRIAFLRRGSVGLYRQIGRKASKVSLGQFVSGAAPRAPASPPPIPEGICR